MKCKLLTIKSKRFNIANNVMNKLQPQATNTLQKLHGLLVCNHSLPRPSTATRWAIKKKYSSRK